MKPQRFKTKPTIKEAIQFKSPEDLIDLKKWCPVAKEHMSNTFKKQLMIKTLEGEMTADIGDWIVKGLNGEFYPVKPDIFAKSHEPLEPEVSP